MSQDYIKSEEIICILKQKKVDVVVHSVTVMDTWEYENVIIIDHINSDIKKKVESGKICTLEAILDNKYQAGIQQYQESGMYYTDLWVDTSKLLFLDNDKINKANSSFYKEVTQIALSNQYSWQWECIAIGVETYIEHRTSLQEMIYNSRNVVRWILVKGVVEYLEGYTVQNIDNIEIYSK